MKRKLLIPVLLALLLIPALACQTVLRALQPSLPIPPGLTELGTALPGVLEGTPIPLPELMTAIPALPGGTAEAPPDIPVVDQKENLVGSQFLVSYQTSMAFDDVVKFYKDQMPAQGWQAGEAPQAVKGFAVLNYVKDKRTATVTVSGAEGKTAVIIAIQEQ
ncbi:MAG: hypothetical protein HY023_16155 [Chloroflexi bacterium]|nr:hypothetical protein [Chloroflexota bacterium]MBI3760761.1 hypothetical protein [Chloroflexota bacterium]